MNLIIDVGMHTGIDTLFYLSQKYKVIAIEANPQLCAENERKFKKFIAQGSLIILNYAISDTDYDEIPFYISSHSSWSSIKSDLAGRGNTSVEKVTVKTRTLKSIIEQYGTPYFCKIDIEGYDFVALESLMGLKQLPKFISVESESSNSIYNVENSESNKTLNLLIALGYTKFKLVDQATLRILSLKGKHYNYKYKNLFYIYRVKEKIIRVFTYFNSNFFFFNFGIFGDSSGIFGENLSGVWSDAELAKEILNKNRKDLLEINPSKDFSFWCDWHATI